MGRKIGTLECKLDELFVRNAPRLPRYIRKAWVAWMPLISLVAAIISFLGATALWHWAHSDKFLGACNAYSVSGCGNLSVSRFTVWFWVALTAVTIEGILYLLAYPGLWSNKKKGWRYVYYGVTLNVIYSMASLFTGSGRVLHFLGAGIISLLGLYILFQIRDLYITKHKSMFIPKTNGRSTLPYGFKKPGEQ